MWQRSLISLNVLLASIMLSNAFPIFLMATSSWVSEFTAALQRKKLCDPEHGYWNHSNITKNLKLQVNRRGQRWFPCSFIIKRTYTSSTKPCCDYVKATREVSLNSLFKKVMPTRRLRLQRHEFSLLSSPDDTSTRPLGRYYSKTPNLSQQGHPLGSKRLALSELHLLLNFHTVSFLQCILNLSLVKSLVFNLANHAQIITNYTKRRQ